MVFPVTSFMNSGSGASPSSGSRVSLVRDIPEYIMNADTISPTYPSAGKSVHKDARSEKATTDVVIESLKLLAANASIALLPIVLPIFL